MKLLAVLAVAVAALLVILWMQIRSPEAVASPEKHENAAPPVAAPAPVQQPGLAEAAKKIEEATKNSDKIDVSSDEFFRVFDDPQPQILTRGAVKCYTGGLKRVHRNGKVKLSFINHIKDGEVFVTDVKVVAEGTTITDTEMVECFRSEVSKVRWKDERLPDYEAPDELVIRPERGMKKHTEENRNYVGAAKGEE